MLILFFGKNVEKLAVIKNITMSYYFSMDIGGLRSEADVSVGVDSFSEIKEMLNAFSEEIPRKFVKYNTQLIMNRSPKVFPHWSKVYMVLATLEDGREIPVGYCNFKKSLFNSFSINWMAIVIAFVSSVIIFIRSLMINDNDIALWSGMVAVLVFIIALNKSTTTKIKLLYLMK